MASKLYPLYQVTRLNGTAPDLTSVSVKALLVNTAGAGTTYTYSDSHEFLSDVTSGARLATTAALTSKTVTGGVFDAADSFFPGGSGDSGDAVIFFVDTGTAGTSRLLAYVDSGVGFPYVQDGADIPLKFSALAGKIFPG